MGAYLTLYVMQTDIKGDLSDTCLSISVILVTCCLSKSAMCLSRRSLSTCEFVSTNVRPGEEGMERSLLGGCLEPSEYVGAVLIYRRSLCHVIVDNLKNHP